MTRIPIGHPEVTDRERTEAWRLLVLIQAGYPWLLAEQLAASSVDLHQAVELVSRGCEPETAVRILL